MHVITKTNFTNRHDMLKHRPFYFWRSHLW